jgi:hypothetical protein
MGLRPDVLGGHRERNAEEANSCEIPRPPRSDVQQKNEESGMWKEKSGIGLEERWSGGEVESGEWRVESGERRRGGVEEGERGGMTPRQVFLDVVAQLPLSILPRSAREI